jgi:hypothetical protein
MRKVLLICFIFISCERKQEWIVFNVINNTNKDIVISNIIIDKEKPITELIISNKNIKVNCVEMNRIEKIFFDPYELNRIGLTGKYRIFVFILNQNQKSIKYLKEYILTEDDFNNDEIELIFN